MQMFSTVGKPVTLANALTLSRIFLTPLICWGILSAPHTALRTLSPFLFMIACATDYFDGYVAHITKTRTQIGAVLDPLADKLLIIMVFFALCSGGYITGSALVAVAIIIFREIFLLGLRNVAAHYQQQLSVLPLAKWKTAFQMLAALLFFPEGWIWAPQAGTVMLWTAAILSASTGYLYLRKALFHMA